MDFLSSVDHVAHVVFDINKAAHSFHSSGHWQILSTYTYDSEGCYVTFLSRGQELIELLQPFSLQSSLGVFLTKRGEGFHHIAFRVNDLDNELLTLSTHYIQLIDNTPRQGIRHSKVAFIHPSSTNGLLIELCEVRHGT
jgi:methylmalonyl-CoA/ethylmalonyl-CoA epimerase